MTPKLTLTTLIVSIALIAPNVSRAADITVVCNSTNCTASPSTPLFQEDNWVPGQGVTKSLEVQNNRNEDCTVQLDTTGVSEAPEGFSAMLLAMIKRGESEQYSGTLSDLYSESVSLGTVGSGDTALYDWSIMLDSNTGNEYQGAEMSFDFAMNFTCPTISPATTSTSDEPTPDIAGDETERFMPRVLAAATGPEEDEKPKPSVLGLADTGYTNYALWYVLISALFIGTAYTLDRKRNRSVR
jgi:hypothetical protein